MGNRLFEITDEADCGLDLVLEVRRQRPVAIAITGAPMVEPAVEGQGEFVGGIAEKSQPAVVTGDYIELVAVNHQQAPAIGGQVLGLIDQADIAQHQLGVTPQEFVVIAGDIDHLGAALAHGQQAADHVGVRLGPVHAAAQLPAIDDVADQVDLIGLIALEELRQVLGLAIARSQVHV
ncbi:hypothetical protein D3C79_708020 [compost metagenome]